MIPATLSRLASAMERRPTLTLRAMIAAGRMGRGGHAQVRLVVGFGVQGQGPSWAEAARQWAAGARARAAEIEAARDLIDRMEAA